MENDNDHLLQKRVDIFDKMGSKLDEAIEEARRNAEEDAAEMGALVAPGAQEQEVDDLMEREEDDVLLARREDHVGRGDVADNIGLSAGVIREMPSMRPSVAIRNEDIRPVIGSLNQEQMIIYENVSILST